MEQLAVTAGLLDVQGKDYSFRAMDFKRAWESDGGCTVEFQDGTRVDFKSTVTEVVAEIDRLWGEWIAELS